MSTNKLEDGTMLIRCVDLQHRLFYETFYRKLYLAPIEVTPKSVLDIGTGITRILCLLKANRFLGTGIWAIDFGNPFLLSVIPD